VLLFFKFVTISDNNNIRVLPDKGSQSGPGTSYVFIIPQIPNRL